MLLRIKDLNYWADQKRRKQILKSVDLEVPIKSSLSIIGPNGAGKSTLLKCIAQLLSPKNKDGRIILDGRNLDTFSQREIGQLISYVPQRPILPPRMKVVDYVLLGRTSHIPIFQSESSKDIEIIREVLNDVGIEWAAGRMLQTLSGGELQLVVLARSLASEAKLLLLDEPTASLDLGHCYELCKLIYELPQKKNISVVTVMHDLHLAGHFGDELMLIHNGEVCEKGRAIEVLTQENIQKYYGIDIKISLGEGGGVNLYVK